MNYIRIMEQKAIAYIPMTLATKAEGADQVYSLPYIDTELSDPELKKQTQRMIKTEMKTMRAELGGIKKDYLVDFKEPNLPIIDSEFIKSEIDRVKGSGVTKIDLTKYENTIEAPEKSDDLMEWDKVINESKQNYEHSINQ